MFQKAVWMSHHEDDVSSSSSRQDGRSLHYREAPTLPMMSFWQMHSYQAAFRIFKDTSKFLNTNYCPAEVPLWMFPGV